QLGQLLNERGKTEEAEHWYRWEAEAGHLGAATNLGLLLKEQGKLDAGNSGGGERPRLDTPALPTTSACCQRSGGTWIRPRPGGGGRRRPTTRTLPTTSA